MCVFPISKFDYNYTFIIIYNNRRFIFCGWNRPTECDKFYNEFVDRTLLLEVGSRHELAGYR